MPKRANTGMPAPTIADLRTVASAIDSPEGEHEALIMRANFATLRHDGVADIGFCLRWRGWCDTDVRECVAAVSEALRALGEAE